VAAKKRKVRTDFRKNREVRARDKDYRGEFAGSASPADAPYGERVSGKGHISRKRTVAGAEIVEDDAGTHVYLDVDRSVCRLGRVLRVQGLVSIVRDEAAQHPHLATASSEQPSPLPEGEGAIFKCATRRLLKTLATDQRHVVAAGDVVWFRPEGSEEGIIERVEPRHGVVSRTSRGRQHVLVANVDQLVIVTSAAEPRIKPNLIDRLLVTAEKSGVRPVICINKIDLIEPADLMPLAGVYAQLGYDVLFVSAQAGIGIDRLRARLAGAESVVTGQSGVGKSSLLNAVEPGLHLRVQTVSEETQKGRHTTTTAELIPLSFGGYVVDTPGIRQFQLWDVIPEEVAGFFRELRPYVSRCRFPDCTHTHEDNCAVKDAVADGWIDARRYESYVQIRSGDIA
jgi:ribosome biogenesis GTPase